MRSATATTQDPVRNCSNAEPTILVIGDEAFVCDATCEILRGAGYRVLHAAGAAAGRAMFLHGGKKIKLLLCDAMLPDGSGVALSQLLRQQSPGLKVVLASGYPVANRREARGSEDSVEFLAKPYGAATLIAKLKTALQSAV
jgi:DNA-binding NtrC family response regulator